MSKKHIEFYKKCMKTGMLPEPGLCLCKRHINTEMLDELFEPDQKELEALASEGLCTTYWASEAPDIDISDNCFKGFPSLRQTIVLFMAAINDEL